jgi:hypothetical protein
MFFAASNQRNSNSVQGIFMYEKFNRYKEHIGSINYNREDSGNATHILNNAQCYGEIEDAKKGRIMTMKENFYIYLYTSDTMNS